jgi:antitoxin HigA-1
LKTPIRKEVVAKENGLLPVHPGEIVKKDILPSIGLSVTAAAKGLGVCRRQMLHDLRASRRSTSAPISVPLLIS